MVISKILVLLQRHNKNINKIVAVHIDYANRDESGQEADYVEGWCSRLGIVFYKRVINEVTRGITNRDEYEKVSRDIRYGFYQEIIALEKCDAVIFGHHKGDVQENVISNVMHGLSPLALSGMSEIGVANNVTVWRPLLAYSKDDIYTFAHQYGVPYFKDTTPSWSTRGKLRKLLVPLLIDMYGEGCLNNLTSLAHQSDESRALVHNAIYQPFLNSISRKRCGISVNVIKFLHQPLMFWKEMLKEIMHSMSMSMVREKSVQNFIERLQRLVQTKNIENTGNSGWIELRKLFYSYIDEKGTLIVFKENVFAPITEKIIRKTSQEKYQMWDRLQRYSLPAEKESIEIKLGSWMVEVTHLVECVDENEVQQLDQIIDLLTGEFSYYITFPVHTYSQLGVYVDYKYDQKDLITASDTEVYSVFDSSFLTKKDMRIKRGLPFLVPLIRDLGGISGKNKSNKNNNKLLNNQEPRATLRFSYKYIE
jgi:tRNA(Ile)-lysidine synthetase-like protein